MRRELCCLAPASPPCLEPRLQLRQGPVPEPRRGEARLRVEASAVNPIDLKRAAGYGQRLLGLKGAGRFPLVLGNDVVGRIEAVGPGVSAWAPGQRVFGLLPTGRRGGAHASQVVVPQQLLQAAPEATDAAALAVLPYSFTTVWLAVAATGLSPDRAASRRVLVHGAAGGLGRLALPWLAGWGCQITAVCATGTTEACRALGVQQAVERGPGVLASLPDDFDVVLNFASWDDEPELAARLGPQALGHATTVHPLLGHFDRLGWWRGALACRRDWQAMRAAVTRRSPAARYAWTVFRPEPAALEALAAGLRTGRLGLPVGLAVPLDRAEQAFAHVAAGRPGRAVLLP